MTLEENILAYLDGSLGADESAELLHTLSASPDKRELLEEHLRLNGITSLGRRPYLVPERAEQALMERLPAIRGVLNGNRFAVPVTFYSRARLLTTAAGAAALAILGAFLWYSSTAQVGHPIMSSASPRTTASDYQNTRNSAQYLKSRNSAPAAKAEFAAALRANATLGQTAVPSQAANSADDNLVITSAPESNPAPAIAQNQDIEISSVGTRDIGYAIPGSLHAGKISEIAYSEPSGVSPFSIRVGYSEFRYSLPSLSTSAAAQSVTAGDVSAGLDYNLSPNFAVGLEDGLSRYAILTNDRSSQASQNYTRVSYTSRVSTASTNWLRLGLEYSPNPESELPFSFGAAGGVAFESTLEPIAALSAGLSRFLGSGTWLELAVLATGTWGAPGSAIGTSSGPDVTGIVHMDITPQQTFTPAIGLRVGLRYR
jgi:hypothetical protein